jgi:hypothetical protein
MSTKTDKLRALLREKLLQEQAEKDKAPEPQKAATPDPQERPASLRGISIQDLIVWDADGALTADEQRWFDKKYGGLLRSNPVYSGPHEWMA